MSKYTDEDIRGLSKITCQIAGDYLGISADGVRIGMRNNLLPIGFAVCREERYKNSWRYIIVAERMIAYKYGKITEVQIANVEKSLDTIIEQFELMKKELLFILNENAEVGI